MQPFSRLPTSLGSSSGSGQKASQAPASRQRSALEVLLSRGPVEVLERRAQVLVALEVTVAHSGPVEPPKQLERGVEQRARLGGCAGGDHARSAPPESAQLPGLRGEARPAPSIGGLMPFNRLGARQFSA